MNFIRFDRESGVSRANPAIDKDDSQKNEGTKRGKQVPNEFFLSINRTHGKGDYKI